jgi:predicted transcriptional regulator
MERITLVEKVKFILGLSKTDLEIIHSLSHEQKLLVSEIAQQTQRSKRHICQRLTILLEKGLLERELHILHNKRMAYRYSLQSSERIAQHLREHLLRTLSELDAI